MIEFTGERVVPGQVDPDLLNEHLGRYRFAEPLVREKLILDAGCGVGYGAAGLAGFAETVFALDVSAEALREGVAEYANVRFLQGDCARLPFADGALDAVVAFEVIEHLEDWPALIREAARVLKATGLFLVSTPNRLYYAETREEPNPFHVHEFDYEEFRAELAKAFPHQKIFLENHANAITFTPEGVEGVRTRMEPAEARPESAHFFLAVCSASPLFGSPAFVYLPQGGNVLRDREQHIDKLTGELRRKTTWLERATAELETMTRIRQKDQQQAQDAIAELEAENERKTEWTQKVKEQLAELEAEYARLNEWALETDRERARALEAYGKLEVEKNRVHLELERAVKLLDKAEASVVERTEWAQRLDRELVEARQQLQTLYASPAYRFGRRLRLAPDFSRGSKE